MANENQTSGLLDIMRATLNAPKTQNIKAEDTISREQIRSDLFQLLETSLNDLLPEEMPRKAAISWVKRVCKAIREQPGLKASTSVNLNSDVRDPEAFDKLPKAKGAVNALTEEAMKEVIALAYGGKPRGVFKRQDWADKLVRDREQSKTSA